MGREDLQIDKTEKVEASESLADTLVDNREDANRVDYQKEIGTSKGETNRDVVAENNERIENDVILHSGTTASKKSNDSQSHARVFEQEQTNLSLSKSSRKKRRERRSNFSLRNSQSSSSKVLEVDESLADIQADVQSNSFNLAAIEASEIELARKMEGAQTAELITSQRNKEVEAENEQTNKDNIEIEHLPASEEDDDLEVELTEVETQSELSTDLEEDIEKWGVVFYQEEPEVQATPEQKRNGEIRAEIRSLVREAVPDGLYSHPAVLFELQKIVRDGLSQSSPPATELMIADAEKLLAEELDKYTKHKEQYWFETQSKFVEDILTEQLALVFNNPELKKYAEEVDLQALLRNDIEKLKISHPELFAKSEFVTILTDTRRSLDEVETLLQNRISRQFQRTITTPFYGLIPEATQHKELVDLRESTSRPELSAFQLPLTISNPRQSQLQVQDLKWQQDLTKIEMSESERALDEIQKLSGTGNVFGLQILSEALRKEFLHAGNIESSQKIQLLNITSETSKSTSDFSHETSKLPFQQLETYIITHYGRDHSTQSFQTAQQFLSAKDNHSPIQLHLTQNLPSTQTGFLNGNASILGSHPEEELIYKAGSEFYPIRGKAPLASASSLNALQEKQSSYEAILVQDFSERINLRLQNEKIFLETDLQTAQEIISAELHECPEHLKTSVHDELLKKQHALLLESVALKAKEFVNANSNESLADLLSQAELEKLPDDVKAHFISVIEEAHQTLSEKEAREELAGTLISNFHDALDVSTTSAEQLDTAYREQILQIEESSLTDTSKSLLKESIEKTYLSLIVTQLAYFARNDTDTSIDYRGFEVFLKSAELENRHDQASKFFEAHPLFRKHQEEFKVLQLQATKELQVRNWVKQNHDKYNLSLNRLNELQDELSTLPFTIIQDGEVTELTVKTEEETTLSEVIKQLYRLPADSNSIPAPYYQRFLEVNPELLRQLNEDPNIIPGSLAIDAGTVLNIQTSTLGLELQLEQVRMSKAGLIATRGHPLVEERLEEIKPENLAIMQSSIQTFEDLEEQLNNEILYLQTVDEILTVNVAIDGYQPNIFGLDKVNDQIKRLERWIDLLEENLPAHYTDTLQKEFQDLKAKMIQRRVMFLLQDNSESLALTLIDERCNELARLRASTEYSDDFKQTLLLEQIYLTTQRASTFTNSQELRRIKEANNGSLNFSSEKDMQIFHQHIDQIETSFQNAELLIKEVTDEESQKQLLENIELQKKETIEAFYANCGAKDRHYESQKIELSRLLGHAGFDMGTQERAVNEENGSITTPGTIDYGYDWVKNTIDDATLAKVKSHIAKLSEEEKKECLIRLDQLCHIALERDDEESRARLLSLSMIYDAVASVQGGELSRLKASAFRAEVIFKSHKDSQKHGHSILSEAEDELKQLELRESEQELQKIEKLNSELANVTNFEERAQLITSIGLIQAGRNERDAFRRRLQAKQIEMHGTIAIEESDGEEQLKHLESITTIRERVEKDVADEVSELEKNIEELSEELKKYNHQSLQHASLQGQLNFLRGQIKAKKEFAAFVLMQEACISKTASQPIRSETILAHLNENYSADVPWVKEKVAEFDVGYNKGKLTAFFQTFIREFNSETMGEIGGATVGGGATGASIGVWFFGVGAIPGYAIGSISGLVALKIRNIARGMQRMSDAYTTGKSSITGMQTLTDSLFTVIDTVTIIAPIKGASSVIRGAGKMSAREAMQIAKQELAHEGKELTKNALHKRTRFVMQRSVATHFAHTTNSFGGKALAYSSIGVFGSVFGIQIATNELNPDATDAERSAGRLRIATELGTALMFMGVMCGAEKSLSLGVKAGGKLSDKVKDVRRGLRNKSNTEINQSISEHSNAFSSKPEAELSVLDIFPNSGGQSPKPSFKRTEPQVSLRERSDRPTPERTRPQVEEIKVELSQTPEVKVDSHQRTENDVALPDSTIKDLNEPIVRERPAIEVPILDNLTRAEPRVETLMPQRLASKDRINDFIDNPTRSKPDIAEAKIGSELNDGSGLNNINPQTPDIKVGDLSEIPIRTKPKPPELELEIRALRDERLSLRRDSVKLDTATTTRQRVEKEKLEIKDEQGTLPENEVARKKVTDGTYNDTLNNLSSDKPRQVAEVEGIPVSQKRKAGESSIPSVRTEQAKVQSQAVTAPQKQPESKSDVKTEDAPSLLDNIIDAHQSSSILDDIISQSQKRADNLVTKTDTQALDMAIEHTMKESTATHGEGSNKSSNQVPKETSKTKLIQNKQDLKIRLRKFLDENTELHPEQREFYEQKIKDLEADLSKEKLEQQAEKVVTESKKDNTLENDAGSENDGSENDGSENDGSENNSDGTKNRGDTTKGEFGEDTALEVKSEEVDIGTDLLKPNSDVKVDQSWKDGHIEDWTPGKDAENSNIRREDREATISDSEFETWMNQAPYQKSEQKSEVNPDDKTAKSQEKTGNESPIETSISENKTESNPRSQKEIATPNNPLIKKTAEESKTVEEPNFKSETKETINQDHVSTEAKPKLQPKHTSENIIPNKTNSSAKTKTDPDSSQTAKNPEDKKDTIIKQQTKTETKKINLRPNKNIEKQGKKKRKEFDFDIEADEIKRKRKELLEKNEEALQENKIEENIDKKHDPSGTYYEVVIIKGKIFRRKYERSTHSYTGNEWKLTSEKLIGEVPAMDNGD